MPRPFSSAMNAERLPKHPEEEVREALEDAAARLGFRIARVNVEVLGTCPTCAAGAA